jgi:hypothetical protein
LTSEYIADYISAHIYAVNRQLTSVTNNAANIIVGPALIIPQLWYVSMQGTLAFSYTSTCQSTNLMNKKEYAVYLSPCVFVTWIRAAANNSYYLVWNF